ncbi:MAG: hypothetical protein ACXV3S_11760, partial [Kineosporiaceae bacterium]
GCAGSAMVGGPLINTFIKPLVNLFALPLYPLTLGLSPARIAAPWVLQTASRGRAGGDVRVEGWAARARGTRPGGEESWCAASRRTTSR